MPGPALSCNSCRQFFRAQHRAGREIADANGQRRDVGLTFLHHVEMRVEGRGLEHLGEGEVHLVGKGCKVGRGNLVPGVLDEMQILDQQVVVAGRRSPSKSAISSAAWGSISATLAGRFWPASGPCRGVVTSGPFVRHDSLKFPKFPSRSCFSNSNHWHTRCQSESISRYVGPGSNGGVPRWPPRTRPVQPSRSRTRCAVPRAR